MVVFYLGVLTASRTPRPWTLTDPALRWFEYESRLQTRSLTPVTHSEESAVGVKPGVCVKSGVSQRQERSGQLGRGPSAHFQWKSPGRYRGRALQSDRKTAACHATTLPEARSRHAGLAASPFRDGAGANGLRGWPSLGDLLQRG
jgi:hypothetical protein